MEKEVNEPVVRQDAKTAVTACPTRRFKDKEKPESASSDREHDAKGTGNQTRTPK